MPVSPRDEQVEFIKEQERKLGELRDEKNKLFKEIDDYLKKAKSAKPNQPKPGFKVEFDSTRGLINVNFTTPAGVVRVYLPDDMRSGDTISGSVVAEPNGQTDEERAMNRKALNSYQLMIASQKAEELGQKNQPRTTFGGPFGSSPDGAIWTFHALWDPGPCTLSVVEVASGKEMARVTIPLSTTESKATRPQTPTPNDFNLPTIGQNGSSVEIKGPFDGNLRTTEITVGNQPVIKRTETPRGCTFQSPEQSFGPADITLKENNVEAKGTYRNLGVRLNAPKTSLLKGETTIVTIEVSGLEGIKEDMPLHLESRGVINMAGGNYQYLQIRPQDVKPDGRYTTTRAITGQQAGGFGVTGTVIDFARWPITDAPFHITLTAGAVKNGYKVIKGADGAFFVNINGAENPKTKKKLEGLFDLEYWCGSASSPVRVSMSFLGGSLPEPIRLDLGPPTLLESECIFQIQGRIRTNPFRG